MENDWSMAIVSGCLWILTLPCESGPEHHRGWHLPPYLNPVPITFFAPFLFMFMILLPSGCEPWISLLIGLPTGFALLLAGFAFAEYRDSNRSRYVTFEYWEGLIQCLVLALIGIVVFGDVNSILGLSMIIFGFGTLAIVLFAKNEAKVVAANVSTVVFFGLFLDFSFFGYCQRVALRISEHSCHLFRSNAATHSGVMLPPLRGLRERSVRGLTIRYRVAFSFNEEARR